MHTEFASASYSAGLPCKESVKRQDGEDKLDRFLPKEITVSEPARSWHEQDGIVYFSVTSDGTTGENWLKRLVEKDLYFGEYAEMVLRSADFKVTSGVMTEVAVLKGMIFKDNERTNEKVRIKANERKLTTPNAEVACLIREKFSDEEIESMGLCWIFAMHKPINDVDVRPCLLNATRIDGGRLLHAYSGEPSRRWSSDYGFAFAVSEVFVANS